MDDAAVAETEEDAYLFEFETGLYTGNCCYWFFGT